MQYIELNKRVKRSARNNKRKPLEDFSSNAKTAAFRKEMCTVYNRFLETPTTRSTLQSWTKTEGC